MRTRLARLSEESPAPQGRSVAPAAIAPGSAEWTAARTFVARAAVHSWRLLASEPAACSRASAGLVHTRQEQEQTRQLPLWKLHACGKLSSKIAPMECG